jgi:hypothetical protein
MKLKFKDNTERSLPFNAKTMARLIVLGQQKGKSDFTVALDESRSLADRQKQLKDVQRFVDFYRVKAGSGKDF